MIVSQIVAVSENNIIGNNNTLPWRLSADLNRFKSLTMGHCVLMGRKTYESIGKRLKGRHNAVLTRDESFNGYDFMTLKSIEHVKSLIKYISIGEFFIIGGAEIYKQTLSITDRIYLTRVHTSVEGDTEHPLLARDEWEETSVERFSADSKNEYDYSFIIYDRIK